MIKRNNSLLELFARSALIKYTAAGEAECSKRIREGGLLSSKPIL